MWKLCCLSTKIPHAAFYSSGLDAEGQAWTSPPRPRGGALRGGYCYDSFHAGPDPVPAPAQPQTDPRRFITDTLRIAITHHNGKHSTFQRAHNLLP